MDMIKVHNLMKLYGDFIAVDDISFEVKKGEILGFLGPNGAGKSTTMKILTCYLAPNKGEVWISGLNIFDHSLEVRKKIGYLPENTPLYQEMNVLECLEFFASMHDIPASKQSKYIKQVVEACGLQEKLKNDIFQLSKGYRQRVGLAQAMIHQPEILILDEPTSGLDPNQIVEIRNLIKEIGKEKTIILSTHILSEVEATCDRVIIINKGKIVGQDSPSELKRKSTQANAIVVSVEGGVREIGKILAEIKGIQNVEKLDTPSEDAHRFKLEVSEEDEMRPKISRALVEAGMDLLEIRKESPTLEDVFHELTK